MLKKIRLEFYNIREFFQRFTFYSVQVIEFRKIGVKWWLRKKVGGKLDRVCPILDTVNYTKNF